jgi:hypothetical protein
MMYVGGWTKHVTHAVQSSQPVATTLRGVVVAGLLALAACGDSGGGTPPPPGDEAGPPATGEDDAGDAPDGGAGGSTPIDEELDAGELADASEPTPDASEASDGSDGAPDATVEVPRASALIPTTGGQLTLDADARSLATLTVAAGAYPESVRVTLSTVSFGVTFPDTVSQVVPGLRVELGSLDAAITPVLRVPLDGASTADLRVLAYTARGVEVLSPSVSGGAAVFDVLYSGDYYVLDLPPPAGCDRTVEGNVDATTDADLETLRGVRRVAGSLRVVGVGVTSLDALGCLVEVRGPFVVRNTAVTGTTGLARLTLVGTEPGNYSDDGALRFDGNTQLTSLTLPSLLAAVGQSRNFWSIGVQGSALLANITLPVLDYAALDVANDGSTADELELSLPALRSVDSLFVTGCPTLAHLDGLATLERVYGSLEIVDASGLTSVAGLAGLRAVTGALELGGLPRITVLDALSRLESADSISIHDNAALRSVALAALTGPAPDSMGVGGANLALRNNPLLVSLEAKALRSAGALRLTNNGSANTTLALAFDVLRELGGSSLFSSNPGLVSLSGLSALESAGDLTIQSNPRLVNLDALAAVRRASALSIRTNNALVSVVLPSLSDVSGALTVANNNALTRVSLGAATSLGTLAVTSNGPAATPLVLSFPQLTTLRADLLVNQNPGLAAIGDFGALTRVEGNVNVLQNAALRALAGLSRLENVVGALAVSQNAAITAVNELVALRSVGSALSVGGNSALLDIDFPALTTVGGAGSFSVNGALRSLRIDGVPQLTSLTISLNGSRGASTTLSMRALERTVNGFTVTSNAALSALDGFPALRSVGSYDVSGNAALATCAAVALRDQVRAAQGIAGTVTISRNLADNCAP